MRNFLAAFTSDDIADAILLLMAIILIPAMLHGCIGG